MLPWLAWGVQCSAGMKDADSQLTSSGYRVYHTHPMAAQGYRYRRTIVAGVVHVDEYVAPVGAWVYMGTLG